MLQRFEHCLEQCFRHRPIAGQDEESATPQPLTTVDWATASGARRPPTATTNQRMRAWSYRPSAVEG
jgi:hypothetical protein